MASHKAHTTKVADGVVSQVTGLHRGQVMADPLLACITVSRPHRVILPAVTILRIVVAVAVVRQLVFAPVSWVL